MVLPHEIFAPDGASVAQGKHDFEIRAHDGQYVLAFLRPEKNSVSIPGTPHKEADSFTVPVTGTVLLWPAKQPQPEESRSKVSPYLTNLDWRATLRLYRSSNPDSNEVRAVFQEGERRIDFVLFRTKPAPSPKKP